MFDYWEATVKPPYRRLAYYFIMEPKDSEGVKVFYSERGFSDKEESRDGIVQAGMFEFPFLNPIDVITPPEWVKNAVFYQIFPERFANGDSSPIPVE